ncbi:hypothetical protein [Kitasatospora sp. NPDC002965]|uniref:hypothetical protein n=1 Tax=Kitasatospora sp. NPDC002965 TaxID=3154775 RepID=UPI0033A0E785
MNGASHAMFVGFHDARHGGRLSVCHCSRSRSRSRSPVRAGGTGAGGPLFTRNIQEKEFVMYGRIRRVSLAVAVAAAVLAGGTAQAHATAASVQPHAAVASVTQSQPSASAIDIWIWEGRYTTLADANAVGNIRVLLGLSAAFIIESVYLGGTTGWVFDLYQH